MNFAVDHLKLDGRILFWVPVIRNESGGSLFDEPKHECLVVVHTVEQILAGNYSRMLICMKKVCERGSIGESNHDVRLQNARSFRENFFESVRMRIEAKKTLKQSKEK